MEKQEVILTDDSKPCVIYHGECKNCRLYVELTTTIEQRERNGIAILNGKQEIIFKGCAVFQVLQQTANITQMVNNLAQIIMSKK